MSAQTPHPYPTSRDYRELALRMAVQRIVCFVDYGSHGDCRDVAATMFAADSAHSRYRISARGIEYISAGTLDEFERQCVADNVEWLISTSEVQP